MKALMAALQTNNLLSVKIHHLDCLFKTTVPYNLTTWVGTSQFPFLCMPKLAHVGANLRTTHFIAAEGSV